MHLLGHATSSPKQANAPEHGIEGAILYLAPAKQSGYNACASSTEGCRNACLYFSGRGGMTRTQQARIRKTKMFFEERNKFLDLLVKDIASVEAIKKNFQPVIRLDGTSDLRWERFGFMEDFPNIQFYDYTKHKNRKNIPNNYDLTFSRSEESTTKDIDRALDNGMNVSVVFEKELPETWHGLQVIDGTENDWRFRDPKPCIVGLTAKGSKGKRDTSGFVILNNLKNW